jgi:hypothetical protein
MTEAPNNSRRRVGWVVKAVQWIAIIVTALQIITGAILCRAVATGTDL